MAAVNLETRCEDQEEEKLGIVSPEFALTACAVHNIVLGTTVYLTPNANALDTTHEMVHVLQFQGGFSTTAAHDEAEAWGLAQAGFLVEATGILNTLEAQLTKGDVAAATVTWNSAWGPQGFPGIIGFDTGESKITNQDLLNIATDLGVGFSCTKLAAVYLAVFHVALAVPNNLPTSLQ